MDSIILADIPGLIEGASSGKGLGIKFLRHIQRTRILAHCLSLESDDLKRDYEIIKKELREYNPELDKKKEFIILTKSDLISPIELKKKMKVAKKISLETIVISVHDWDSLENLKKKLIQYFQ
jgi:GTP-binding protein